MNLRFDRNGALHPDQLTLHAVIRRFPILGTGSLKVRTAFDSCGLFLRNPELEASLVEQAFAIFTNNIKMDETGKVLNLTHSMKRAAQWIRLVCKDKKDLYKVDPEFEDWEVELH